ncbi:MAG: hypothetical protein WCL61_02190 [bacterium]
MSYKMKPLRLSEVLRLGFKDKVPLRKFSGIEPNEDEVEENSRVWGVVNGDGPKRWWYLYQLAEKYYERQKRLFMKDCMVADYGLNAGIVPSGPIDIAHAAILPPEKKLEFLSFLKAEDECLNIIADMFDESIISQHPLLAYPASEWDICYGWHVIVAADFDEQLPLMFRSGYHFLNDYFRCVEEIITGRSKIKSSLGDRFPAASSRDSVLGVVISEPIKQLYSLTHFFDQVRQDYWPDNVEDSAEGVKIWRRQQMTTDWDIFSSRNNRLDALMRLTHNVVIRLIMEEFNCCSNDIQFKFCHNWQIAVINKEDLVGVN